MVEPFEGPAAPVEELAEPLPCPAFAAPFGVPVCVAVGWRIELRFGALPPPALGEAFGAGAGGALPVEDILRAVS